MIRSLDHSLTVQARRLQSGKIGVSKAVRRYLLKHHEDKYRETRDKLMREAWSMAEPKTEEEAA